MDSKQELSPTAVVETRQPLSLPPRAAASLASSPTAAVEIESYRGAARLGERPPLLGQPFSAAAWALRAVYGIVTLVVLLAILAVVPLVNFVVLGCLLESEAGLAKTGRLRGGFPLLAIAPRLGSIALGVWLWLIPLRLLANAAADARLIDTAGAAARRLATLTTIAAVLVGIHLCLALARGGSLGCFFRPIKNLRWTLARWRAGRYLDEAATEVREFLSGLRLRHHFSLGARGFVGAFAWLVVPSALFAAADRREGGRIVVTIAGGLLLATLFAWMPFLQARFAVENRLRAMFELGEVRRLFCRAPLAWLLAILAVYALALPLYLLKIFLLPQDAMWFVTLVFIVTIAPARLMTGWAYGRALRKPRRAWWGLRWTCRALVVPVVVAFVFLLFFTQFIGQHGKGVLFEHHAFLLPVPF